MIILVDYENTHQSGMEGYWYLDGTDKLVLYYSDVKSAMPKACVKTLKARGVDVKLVKLQAKRDNALDMYIAASTGIYAEQHQKICIVSKDKGYQAVRDFWSMVKGTEILLGETIEQCMLHSTDMTDPRIQQVREQHQKANLVDEFQHMDLKNLLVKSSAAPAAEISEPAVAFETAPAQAFAPAPAEEAVVPQTEAKTQNQQAALDAVKEQAEPNESLAERTSSTSARRRRRRNKHRAEQKAEANVEINVEANAVNAEMATDLRTDAKEQETGSYEDEVLAFDARKELRTAFGRAFEDDAEVYLDPKTLGLGTGQTEKAEKEEKTEKAASEMKEQAEEKKMTMQPVTELEVGKELNALADTDSAPEAAQKNVPKAVQEAASEIMQENAQEVAQEIVEQAEVSQVANKAGETQQEHLSKSSRRRKRARNAKKAKEAQEALAKSDEPSAEQKQVDEPKQETGEQQKGSLASQSAEPVITASREPQRAEEQVKEQAVKVQAEGKSAPKKDKQNKKQQTAKAATDVVAVDKSGKQHEKKEQTKAVSKKKPAVKQEKTAANAQKKTASKEKAAAAKDAKKSERKELSAEELEAMRPEAEALAKVSSSLHEYYISLSKHFGKVKGTQYYQASKKAFAQAKKEAE